MPINIASPDIRWGSKYKHMRPLSLLLALILGSARVLPLYPHRGPRLRWVGEAARASSAHACGSRPT